MKRFTISLHKLNSSSEHLDIFFEIDKYLETYEAPYEKVEELMQQKQISCSKKDPHRKVYLDYEGEVSNQRGIVSILWKGFYVNGSNYFPDEINICFVKEKNLLLVSNTLQHNRSAQCGTIQGGNIATFKWVL